RAARVLGGAAALRRPPARSSNSHPTGAHAPRRAREPSARRSSGRRLGGPPGSGSSPPSTLGTRLLRPPRSKRTPRCVSTTVTSLVKGCAQQIGATDLARTAPLFHHSKLTVQKSFQWLHPHVTLSPTPTIT